MAEAGPRAVHRGIAAADHDDVATHLQRLAQVCLLHEVDAVLDTGELGPGDVEPDGIHRAGADRDAIEVAEQGLEADVRPDLRVVPERDAQPFHEAHVHLDRLAGQPEGGHADQHRAAGEREAIEDGDAVTLDRQLAGDRDARRPGPDHRDALVPRRDRGENVRDPGRLVPFDQEPLHRPDGERPVDVTAAAGALARRGADVGAHRGDRVRLPREEIALLEAAFRGQVQVAAAIRADRAGFLALDVALEPGRVHRLDEELLVGVDGHDAWASFVPAAAVARGANAARRRPTPEIDGPESTRGCALVHASVHVTGRVRRAVVGLTRGGRIDARRPRSYARPAAAPRRSSRRSRGADRGTSE